MQWFSSGDHFWEEVQTRLLFGREFIECNFYVTYGPWADLHLFQTMFVIGWENIRDGDITMPLSLKTIGSVGYRDQWNKSLDGCRSIVTFGVVPCWHWMFFITSKWCSTYSKQRDHTMTRQKMFAFKRLKTMENYKTIEPKSCCKCLWDMFFMRGSSIIKGFGENFLCFGSVVTLWEEVAY